MNYTLLMPLPFDRCYIDLILDIFCKTQPFIVLGIENQMDPYCIEKLMYSKDFEGKTIFVHIDLNICSYLHHFIINDRRSIKEQKIAIAIYVYLKLIKAEMGSAFAIMEYRSVTIGDNAKIIAQFQSLFTLKSISIKKLVEFLEDSKYPIFKTKSSMDLSNVPQITDYIPAEWYSCYLHLLKIAEFDYGSNEIIESIKDYLDWINNEYKCNSICLYYSLIALSKGRYYLKTIKNLKNIAWDLSLVTYWFRESIQGISNGDKIHILATNDGELKDIARMISAETKFSMYESESLGFLSKYYKNPDVLKIRNLLDNFQIAFKNPDRKKRTFDAEINKQLINNLEISHQQRLMCNKTVRPVDLTLSTCGEGAEG